MKLVFFFFFFFFFFLFLFFFFFIFFFPSYILFPPFPSSCNLSFIRLPPPFIWLIFPSSQTFFCLSIAITPFPLCCYFSFFMQLLPSYNTIFSLCDFSLYETHFFSFIRAPFLLHKTFFF